VGNAGELLGIDHEGLLSLAVLDVLFEFLYSFLPILFNLFLFVLTSFYFLGEGLSLVDFALDLHVEDDLRFDSGLVVILNEGPVILTLAHLTVAITSHFPHSLFTSPHLLTQSYYFIL